MVIREAQEENKSRGSGSQQEAGVGSLSIRSFHQTGGTGEWWHERATWRGDWVGWARLTEGQVTRVGEARIWLGRQGWGSEPKRRQGWRAQAAVRRGGMGASHRGLGGEGMSLPQSPHALHSCFFLFLCCQQTSVRPIG